MKGLLLSGFVMFSTTVSACDLSLTSTCIVDTTQTPSLGVVSGAASIVPVVGAHVEEYIDKNAGDGSDVYKWSKEVGKGAAILGGGEVFGAFKAVKALRETKAAIEAARVEVSVARAEAAKAKLELEAIKSAQTASNKKIEEIHDVLVAMPKAKAEHTNSKGD